ncbi:RING finger protein 141-like [Ptychodera flava]|uniref:RING finger protein 141-like n=1 Tax=Ptychodera flava TaxID=63121 RepID=UPI00396A51E2
MFRKVVEKVTQIMGQTQAAAIEKIHKHGGILGQLTVLKYDDFLALVSELNEIASSLPDPGGKKLQFEVKFGTDTSVLWKSTVRIRCKKLDRENQMEQSRVMNLHQFVQLYNTMTSCVSSQESADDSNGNSSQAESTPLQASTILQKIGGYEDDSMDCCICMDAKTDVILPCNHMYCEKCIDTWDVSHHFCPVCRQEIKNQKESWVLPEKPDEEEVADYLMGVAGKTGRREPDFRPL